jgi:hypothetical protein
MNINRKFHREDFYNNSMSSDIFNLNPEINDKKNQWEIQKEEY